MKQPSRRSTSDRQPADIANRFGHESIFAAAIRSRAKWGSPQARALRQRLEAAGHTVERQFRLGQSLYAADFFLPRYRVAVLLGGRINGYRRRNLQQSRIVICKALGYTVVTAAEADTVETILARLAACLPATPAALAA